MGSIRLEFSDNKIIIEYEARKMSDEEIEEITKELLNIDNQEGDFNEKLEKISEKLIDVIIRECATDINKIVNSSSKIGDVSITKEEENNTTKYIISYDPEKEESITLAEIISTGIARLPFQRFETLYSESENLINENEEKEE